MSASPKPRPQPRRRAPAAAPATPQAPPRRAPSSRAKGEAHRKAFRERLKAWCQAEEGRASQLAKGVGVSRPVVSFWTTGRRYPTLEQALGVIKYLRAQGFDALGGE